MVEVPVPAAIGEVALTVDWPAETGPAFTTTVAVWVIATALMVADAAFEPAAVELKVPVTTPLASVVPSGCVSVFPAVGVAASVTVAPSIGFPLASRAVTVMVDWLDPLDALIGEVAVTVDCAADTAPAFTTTVAVCVIAAALIVAEIVFDSASVDDSVPVATPLAFVVAAGCVSVLPDPVVASTTVAPWIGLPFASRAVTVIVELPLPAAIGDVALTVDCAADTGPAFASTVTRRVIATATIVSDAVFLPAAVELRLPVTTPPASVVPSGCVSVFPEIGRAASRAGAPLSGVPTASRAITVTVD